MCEVVDDSSICIKTTNSNYSYALVEIGIFRWKIACLSKSNFELHEYCKMTFCLRQKDASDITLSLQLVSSCVSMLENYIRTDSTIRQEVKFPSYHLTTLHLIVTAPYPTFPSSKLTLNPCPPDYYVQN